MIVAVRHKLRKLRSRRMGKLLKELENIFAAITFAEAGEYETAKELLKEEPEDTDSDSNADNLTFSEFGLMVEED